MKFLGWIITVLDAKMQEPTMFGWFHLLFIALTVVATVFLCKRFKNANEKTVRKICPLAWAAGCVQKKRNLLK